MKIFPEEEEDSFTFILAPLMDVMLFVLMFFMLSYSTKMSWFQDISLPSSKSTKNQQNRPSYSVLDYDKNGKYFLDGRPISFSDLHKALSDMTSHSKDLILRADKNLSYQKIVDTMDMVKRAGIHKIYLATQD